MSVAKAETLKDVLTDRDPYCSGVFTVPEQQLTLYYEHGMDLKWGRRINFAQSTTEEVEDLTKACEPAPFGLNNKDVLDETYRKAGRMNPDSFATSFDPHTLGIHDIIERELLSTNQAVDLELYKLNVYGEGGFFKAHQDTPRGDSMFGTLVIVLPVPHEGGQLSLRVDERQWIIDFTDEFKSATGPSICFVAFFGDVEHQVLPVTSGHRVTLTYNLYFRSPALTGSTAHRLLGSAFQERLKQALVDLVNDPETLPNGGCLGVGLCHQYVYDDKKGDNEKRTVDDALHDMLKGVDAALAGTCSALGLPYNLRLLYRAQDQDKTMPPCDMISPRKLGDKDITGYDDDNDEWKHFAYSIIWPDTQGVKLVGGKYRGPWIDEDDIAESLEALFEGRPVLEVLEVKEMSGVVCDGAYACYWNEVTLYHYYGKVCMMISVEPIESRARLGL